MVTVPVAANPPNNIVGLSVTLTNEGELMVKVAMTDVPESEAVIREASWEVSGWVLTVNEAL
jgi:hypothetical protein